MNTAIRERRGVDLSFRARSQQVRLRCVGRGSRRTRRPWRSTGARWCNDNPPAVQIPDGSALGGPDAAVAMLMRQVGGDPSRYFPEVHGVAARPHRRLRPASCLLPHFATCCEYPRAKTICCSTVTVNRRSSGPSVKCYLNRLRRMWKASCTQPWQVRSCSANRSTTRNRSRFHRTDSNRPEATRRFCPGQSRSAHCRGTPPFDMDVVVRAVPSR